MLRFKVGRLRVGRLRATSASVAEATASPSAGDAFDAATVLALPVAALLFMYFFLKSSRKNT